MFFDRLPSIHGRPLMGVCWNRFHFFAGSTKKGCIAEKKIWGIFEVSHTFQMQEKEGVKSGVRLNFPKNGKSIFVISKSAKTWFFACPGTG
jgi:hypothetical protein